MFATHILYILSYNECKDCLLLSSVQQPTCCENGILILSVCSPLCVVCILKWVQYTACKYAVCITRYTLCIVHTVHIVVCSALKCGLQSVDGIITQLPRGQKEEDGPVLIPPPPKIPQPP